MIRILLADDHEVVRGRLRRMLEQHDEWNVCYEASDGQEAVEKFKSGHPDITVIDFQMPKANGLEASEKIIQQDPGSPILMLTAHATSQLMDKAKKVGVRGFCSKSEIDCIVEAVSTLLRGGTYYRN
jgi:DNA-binding NarL/FixJ family response regulator